MSTPESTPSSYGDAKADLERYCAYQERCQSEVERKMEGMGLRPDERDELLVDLITSGFLNEERYAKAFVRGKFRSNKWGRYKIRQGLKTKRVSVECIAVGLQEIDEDEYMNVLRDLMEQKARSVKDKNTYTRNRKIANYLLQKGFESELVWEEINAVS